MYFSYTDWAIVLIFVAILAAVAIFAKRYTLGVTDFLAANRCAGRYLLAMSAGAAALGLTLIIQNWEVYYKAGFNALWWGFMLTPVGFILSITGFVIYRYRQTRAMTMAQFFELRYSRKFRIFAGILAWGSGMLNYGVFPAVTARCLIYFCGIPIHMTNVLGIEVNLTMIAVMTVMLSIAVTFTLLGGQITVIITDFIQGQLLSVAFFAVLAVLVFKMDWSHIMEILKQAPEGQSMLNPFEQGKLEDFNVWFFVMMTVLVVYGWQSWQGNQSYNCSAKSPHEARMANVVGNWRGYMLTMLFVFVPVCAYVVLHSPKFATVTAEINASLSSIDSEQMREQMRVSTTLTHILPIGVVGLMAAALVAAAISTDDTYMHAWGSIFIQDVVLPIRQKRLTTEEHLKWLRWSIVGIAIFALIFSSVFKLKDYLAMWTQLTGVIYMGGAGSAILGGLYWKRGTTAGAWAGMIIGSTLAVISIVLQNILWPYILPALQSSFENISWIQNSTPGHFPLNGMQMSFITAFVALFSYITVSLLTKNDPDFDIDRILHRGQYAVKDDQVEVKEVKWYQKLFGITEEFTFVDKVIYFFVIIVTFSMFGVFCIGTFLYKTFGGTDDDWGKWWHFYMTFLFVLSAISVVWFLFGGIKDAASLFRDLKSAKRNALDDGTIVGHHNLADESDTNGNPMN